MIIKTISRTSGGFGQLIRYVTRQHTTVPRKEAVPLQMRYMPLHTLTAKGLAQLAVERTDAALLAVLKEHTQIDISAFIERYIKEGKEIVDERLGGNPIVITHGLRSRSIEGYIKEFQDNERERRYARKGAVIAHHSIISFNSLDNKFITEQMLRDIAQKYISLRGPDSLWLACVHADTLHTHVHLVQSGVKVGTGLAARVSKQEFQTIKRTLQEFQKDKYPELAMSLPQHGKSKQVKAKDMEQFKNIKTNERAEQLSMLQSMVEMAFATAASKDEFLLQMQQLGHQPYYRNERLAGIRYNGEEKFRLNTLGISEQEIDNLDLTTEQQKELAALRSLRERPQQQEQSRLDRYEQDKAGDDRAIEENPREDREQAWEPETVDLSDFTEDEINGRDTEDREDDREDDRMDHDEWGFDREDDAYDLDR